MKFLKLLIEENTTQDLKAKVIELLKEISEIEERIVENNNHHIYELNKIKNIVTVFKSGISKSIIEYNKITLKDLVEIGKSNKNAEKELNNWVNNFYVYFNTLKEEKLDDWIIELSKYVDLLTEKEKKKKENNNNLKKTQILGNESLADLKSIIVKLTDQLSKLKINITSINKNNKEESTVYNNKMKEYVYNIIENIEKNMVEQIDILYTIANTRLSGQYQDILKMYIDNLKKYFNKIYERKYT